MRVYSAQSLAHTGGRTHVYLHFPSRLPQRHCLSHLMIWLAFYLNFMVSLSQYFPLLGNGFFQSESFIFALIFASSKGSAHSRYPATVCGTGTVEVLVPSTSQHLPCQSLQRAIALSHRATCLRRSRDACWSWCTHASLNHPLLRVGTNGS